MALQNLPLDGMLVHPNSYSVGNARLTNLSKKTAQK